MYRLIEMAWIFWGNILYTKVYSTKREFGFEQFLKCANGDVCLGCFSCSTLAHVAFFKHRVGKTIGAGHRTFHLWGVSEAMLSMFFSSVPKWISLWKRFLKLLHGHVKLQEIWMPLHSTMATPPETAHGPWNKQIPGTHYKMAINKQTSSARRGEYRVVWPLV